MWKNLIYNNETYNNFLINENGEIKNKNTNHIYKPYMNKTGYVVITLPMKKRGKAKSIRLHKAIAENFIPNPLNLKIVHHKDENKSNYKIKNLEWASNKTNTLNHLLELRKNDILFNNRKLTKENIEFIKTNKNKNSYNDLAKQFNVSKTTIINVINEKYYINGIW